MAVKAKVSKSSVDELLAPSANFRRAVHLRHDHGNVEAIERYVPTSNAVRALSSIIRGTQDGATQRSHILHAAYGSGKSLFAVVLTELLENNEKSAASLHELIDQIKAAHPEIGQAIEAFTELEQRFLPVLLVGDEGDFATSLSRGLSRSLEDHDVNFQPQTRFETALEIIQRWKEFYPDAFKKFKKSLSLNGTTYRKLKSSLAKHDVDAFDLFASLYSEVTAGASFDHFEGQTPDVFYREVAGLLPAHGFDGIVVIWDEFGRFLDNRTSKAFGTEAQHLQSFAEACNYSGQEQMHLILLAHKELQSYATGLPRDYQKEWSRIEGRFQKQNVESDPNVVYGLIGSAIETRPPDISRKLLTDGQVESLAKQSKHYRLFDPALLPEIREQIYRNWPLHPLATYSLATISNRVSQNERTLFTYLAVDEPDALRWVARSLRVEEADPFVGPASLWQYFEDSFRADTGIGGAHSIWSGVKHALDKIPSGDLYGEAIAKTLGVLLGCTDAGVVRPTTDLICWAMGADSDDSRAAVVQALENLRRRKAVIHRQVDGYWTFTSGSDVDFEEKLTEVLERAHPTPTQLRRLLQRVYPAPFTVARRFNQNHSMTRFFKGIYRWPEELEDTPWEAQLKSEKEADGLIVYVLATDEVSQEMGASQGPNIERVVFVYPMEPLVAFVDSLRELFALGELENDPSLMPRDDSERIRRELEWLMEDTQARIQQDLGNLVDTRKGRSQWLSQVMGESKATLVEAPSAATRLISEICERVFAKTPDLNSEGLNRHRPTTQQRRAAELVINKLFTQPPAHHLNLEGRGPEVLACSTLLELPGILRESDEAWEIRRPAVNAALQEIWDVIEGYLDDSNTDEGLPIEGLIERLIAPPFGLRVGVLPVLLAATMRDRLRVATIYKDGRPSYPISGNLINDIVNHPSKVSIQIGAWNESLAGLWDALEGLFSNYIFEVDRQVEPLSMVKSAMVRWLQSLPPYCRDTRTVSDQALRFRDLIREAQVDPARVINYELPSLIQLDDAGSSEEVKAKIQSLMNEITNAFLALQRRLDVVAVDEFSIPGITGANSASSVLRSWLEAMQSSHEINLSEAKFSSPQTQAFVDTLLDLNRNSDQIWEQLAVAVGGVHLRDWNDRSEEKFTDDLREIRKDLAEQAEELLREDSIVSISLDLPDGASEAFRFRTSQLSEQGRRILQNFMSTLEVSGRPLSLDEKRQIAVNFLRHVMGEDIEP